MLASEHEKRVFLILKNSMNFELGNRANWQISNLHHIVRVYRLIVFAS